MFNFLSIFRAWDTFLVLLVVYSAWFSPFQFAFLSYEQDALFVFDNVINSFFAVDIVLTFFVAYLDEKTYVVIDDPKRIALRYYFFSPSQILIKILLTVLFLLALSYP